MGSVGSDHLQRSHRTAQSEGERKAKEVSCTFACVLLQGGRILFDCTREYLIASRLLFIVFAKKAYGRAYRQFYCGLGSKLGLSDCVALGIDLKGLLARTNIQSTTCVFLIVGDVSVLTHRHRGQSFPASHNCFRHQEHRCMYICLYIHTYLKIIGSSGERRVFLGWRSLRGVIFGGALSLSCSWVGGEG